MTTNSSKGFRNVPPPQGGSTPRNNTPYSRFIPREELGSFAAWSPHTLNAELDGSAAAAEAAAPAAETPAVQAQVAAARQAGYQDGYRDGPVALDSSSSPSRCRRRPSWAAAARLRRTARGAGAADRGAVARSAVLLARRWCRAEIA